MNPTRHLIAWWKDNRHIQTGARGGWNNHYFKIANLNLTGDVKVEFTCRSAEAIMDNISWTRPRQPEGATR
jgi:hypothetical protein